MKYKIRAATPDDEKYVRHEVEWCREYRQPVAGLFYTEEGYTVDGVDLLVFCTPETTKLRIKQAVESFQAARDVVSIDFLICPKEWLLERSTAPLSA